MNRLKKWIRYVPDRIDDGLRYLCGRMSPDVRLVCVVAMLTGFGCLSIYMTVSSIYRIGRHEGEQLQMEHIRRMELYRGINNYQALLSVTDEYKGNICYLYLQSLV